jgi:hypothetical protein
MKPQSKMAALFTRLKAKNYLTTDQINYIRKNALPSWWSDDIAATNAGFAQGALLIARHTGLDVRFLLDDLAVPFTYAPNCGSPKFKQHINADEAKSEFTVNVIKQAACIVAEATRSPYRHIPSSVAELRRAIRSNYSAPVTLKTLTAWCWEHGIPVIHLSELPAHKPQALVTLVHGRPVVILCEKQRMDARLAFLIAHELTHITLGHVLDDEVRTDTAISIKSDDAEEQAANAGAGEILTGNSEAVFTIPHAVSASTLAQQALSYGRQKGIDPGAILLNLSYHQPKYHGLVTKTLQGMYPDADAPAVLRHEMNARLNWNELVNDDAAFLRKLSAL